MMIKILYKPCHTAWLIFQRRLTDMIEVTRLNDKEFTINCDLIEFIEETPDTVITFTTGTKIVVKENSEEIKRRIVEYKRSIFQ